MKKIVSLCLVALAIVLPSGLHAAILHVPFAYGTIQSAIDAAGNGDIVLVEPGTYYEHLNTNGKNIILCSRYFFTSDPGYIGSTILDGSGSGRVITIAQWEDASCQVVGFTIQNGNSTWEPNTNYGGGICIWDASPRILNCIIRNNTAPANGGGIAINGTYCGAKVINCTITNNTADSFGGGAFMGDCGTDTEILNCIISGNAITCDCSFSGGGGGVNIYHAGKLTNCLIINNSARYASVGGGGVFCDWGDLFGGQSIFVTGCTIANNQALDQGGGVGYVITGGFFANCIIWGNTDINGNVSNYYGNDFSNCCSDPWPAGPGCTDSDPVFTDTIAGNFRLSTGSPCIDAGDNGYNLTTTDLDGNPRIVNGTIDMGAYESGTSLMDVQVGWEDGTSWDLPVNSCYAFGYTQQIYQAGEITGGGGGPGFINKLRFFYEGGATNPSAWNSWTIYIGNTVKNDFSGTSDWIPADSLKQVFSGTISDPVPGNWLEISLTAPFYYTGNNLVVALHENSPDWDCSTGWGAFYTGSPRGMGYFDYSMNPDPAAPPEANFGPDYWIPEVQFGMNTASGDLEGNVTEQPACITPIQGATVTAGPFSTVTDATGYYHLHLPAGTYYNITASFLNACQVISSFDIIAGNIYGQDFCLPPNLPPPANLRAEVYGTAENNVHLTWTEPGTIANQWIQWGNGTLIGSLGYGAPYTFQVASRWPVADITPYNGAYLRKIRFFCSEATSTYTLKVWKGADASTLLYSQAVSDPYINAWNDVTLATPVLIDGSAEFWFGYEVYQPVNGYPVGLTQGPAVAGKGDMINGGWGWASMKNDWGWDFNFAIQGFVAASELGPLRPITVVQNDPPAPYRAMTGKPGDRPLVFLRDKNDILYEPSLALKTEVQPLMSGQRADAPSGTFTGYTVYRNFVAIASGVTTTAYDDTSLPKGGYDYQVTAQYDNGESVPAGPVHADIYTCFPPTDLTVSNATLSTTTADLSWTPSTISTNPQWELEWGPAGFTQGFGTYAFINTSPAYSLTNLTPGAEYDFYVRTYCSSTDGSAWIRKSFRTHYFNCPSGAVAESEPCGTAADNGCEQDPTATGTIQCGDTICGTAWLHRSHRDPDWYALTLAQTMDVTITARAEFTCFVGIANTPCSTPGFISSSSTSPGYPISLVTQLSPGTYYILVAPNWGEQVSCDSVNRYWLTASCNTCLAPGNLNAVNITSSSADLTWTSNGSSWNIEWGLHGFARGTGTVVNGTTTNPYPLTGLTMGQTYSFYVQSLCGGGTSGNWAGPCSFYVPCPAATMPYSEDFTAQLTGATPQCWQVHGAGGPTNWIVEFDNFAGGSSPELSFKPWSNYFSGYSLMTSPVINTSGMGSINLSFRQRIDVSSPGTSCAVMTTSDGGTTWHDVWALAPSGTYGPELTSLNITTPDAGSATFQFAFVVNGNSWNLSNWWIDDISLTGAPVTGTLEGTVTKCSNSDPMQGVTVTAGIYSTTTNSSGFYSFPGIATGSYSVSFSYTGYVTVTLSANVQAGMTTTLNTCLSPASPPVNRSIQNVTVSMGQDLCYDASQTITVAGSGTTFVVESGGRATLLAGVSIDYLPGAHILTGGYMLGRILPSGPFCNGTKEPSFAGAEGSQEAQGTVETGGMKIYPNPTGGDFRIELTGEIKPGNIRVDIYGMQGEKVLSGEAASGRTIELSLPGNPAGIYLVRVLAGDRVYTGRIIRIR